VEFLHALFPEPGQDFDFFPGRCPAFTEDGLQVQLLSAGESFIASFSEITGSMV